MLVLPPALPGGAQALRPQMGWLIQALEPLVPSRWCLDACWKFSLDFSLYLHTCLHS